MTVSECSLTNENWSCAGLLLWEKNFNWKRTLWTHRSFLCLVFAFLQRKLFLELPKCIFYNENLFTGLSLSHFTWQLLTGMVAFCQLRPCPEHLLWIYRRPWGICCTSKYCKYIGNRIESEWLQDLIKKIHNKWNCTHHWNPVHDPWSVCNRTNMWITPVTLGHMRWPERQLHRVEAHGVGSNCVFLLIHLE